MPPAPRRNCPGDHAPGGDAPEWAKLDMHEFQGIEDYDAIKGIIGDRLAAHGVGSTWFPDPETGKEYLLFRIADAREVWQSFDELSRETDDAAAKAAERIREQHDKNPSRDRRRPYARRARGGCARGCQGARSREAHQQVALHRAPLPGDAGEVTAAGIIWAAALSVISFLAANTYTACLLSLPGSPISNLTAR